MFLSIIISLILVFYAYGNEKDKSLNVDENKSYQTGDSSYNEKGKKKILDIGISYKGDIWGSSFNLNINDNGYISEVIPKQKVYGYRNYLYTKFSAYGLNLEKSFLSTNYDYLSLSPSGFLSMLVGYKLYEINTKDLYFNKQWLGLFSAIGIETVKYKYTANNTFIEAKKNKYGFLLGEGYKFVFDFYIYMVKNKWNSYNRSCNNYYIFLGCVTDKTILFFMPTGDFYYVESDYKINNKNINLNGYGFSFGLVFTFISEISKNLIIGLNSRYVYGVEKTNNKYQDDIGVVNLEDTIEDYYITLYLEYRFSL